MGVGLCPTVYRRLAGSPIRVCAMGKNIDLYIYIPISHPCGVIGVWGGMGGMGGMGGRAKLSGSGLAGAGAGGWGSERKRRSSMYC